jgi:cell division protein ZapE
MRQTLTEIYEARVAAGSLRADPAQHAVLGRLEELRLWLEENANRRVGLFAGLFARPLSPPKGMYLWGGVGRGKSMLMDLFHHTLASDEKRRVHFHAFMLEVHALLKIEREKEAGDPIPPVAAKIAEGVRCLCFDELVVNNSADAMIMSRLFKALILDEAVTIVGTSNRPPRDLYKDGLNREHFVPFIALVESELDVLELNGPVDYRLERLGGMPVWHVPNGPGATVQLREAFFRLTDYNPEDAANVPSTELDVGGGRTLHVPKSLKGVAVFSFKRLCGEARGAADYLAIARKYHIVFVVGIPLMGPEQRNEAARFVTLVDALYEHNVILVASADAEPEALHQAGDGSFEFERTASRLREMQSADYMARGHGVAG